MAVLPDPEGLLISAMSSVPAIAGPVDGRISTRLAGQAAAYRVTLVGGIERPAVNTGQPEFQIEAWGGGKTPADERTAWNMAAAVEANIAQLVGVYPTGRVVSAYTFGFIIHSVDQTTSRERYLLQVGLFIQPL
jgi:hypothetical protein